MNSQIQNRNYKRGHKLASSLCFAVLTALFTACENSDMPVQHADNNDAISFSVQPEQMITRTNPYEAYNPTKHPGSMGVFGYHDIEQYDDLTGTQSTTIPANPIFDNTVVSYQAADASWTYTPNKKWDEYKGAKTFDFFAYMPQLPGAQLSRASAQAYTLSIPLDMSKSPLTYDITQAPLICAKPEHKEGTNASGNQFTFERLIKFKFDQTLTGYQLLFKLDSKMGAIREFHIKQVTFTGELATAGTVSRTYTWNGSDWTAGDRLWTDLTRTSFDDSPFILVNKTASPSNEAQVSSSEDTPLIVTSDDYVQWGSTFYTIPDSKFNPTIHVTYDVVFVDKAHTDNENVVTRKDVTSTITLNKSNFDKLTTGGIAMVNPVRILIQPRYLHVLADGDAYTGHLLID